MKKLNYLFVILFSCFAINLNSQITITIAGCNASVDGTYVISATGEVNDGKETYDCTGCGPMSSNLEMAWDGTQWVATVSGSVPIPFSIVYGTNINCTPTPPCEEWDTPLCPAAVNTITGDCSPIVPLPIQLSKFVAFEDLENVKLEWTTIHELNNEGFEILHSIDGINWEIINFVKGSLHSDKTLNYNYTHKSPIEGQNYYQLKQIDLDGVVSFSDIETVRIETDFGRHFHISPNPVGIDRILNITRLGSEEVVYLSIINQTGKIVKSTVLDFEGDLTIVNLKDLADGIYFVNLNSGKQRTTQRIYLMH